MKRFIALCMTGIMLMSAPVFADGIIYNGAAVSYSDQQPIIEGGRTYVPIRDVFEKLGFEVDWDSDTKIVTLSNDYYNVMVLTGTSKLVVTDTYMNIKASKLENTVKLVNGRTMLPLREILENVGYELVWDAETKTTTIKDNNDYTALDAEKEKLNTMVASLFGMGASDSYELDTTKPVGTLTAEEKAWLENLASVVNGVESSVESLGLTELDLDSMNGAEVKAVVLPIIDKLTKDINSVDCPDSLKAFNAALGETLTDVKGIVSDACTLADLMEDETDEVKENITFGMTMVILARIAPSLIDAQNAYNDFMRSGNYDPDSEDFTALADLSL